MKTNKTPIQELIDEIHRSNISSQKLMTSDAVMLGRVFENMLYETLEKEKQFAFDCFEAGNRFGMDVCGSFDCGQQPTKPDFDEFYSKYVSQHKK